jgi:hypothetical protein
MSKLTKISIDPNNEWLLVREGIDDKGKNFTTTLAVPPTKGDRTDIITDKPLEEGYRIGVDIIVIVILSGKINSIYF